MSLEFKDLAERDTDCGPPAICDRVTVLLISVYLQHCDFFYQDGKHYCCSCLKDCPIYVL